MYIYCRKKVSYIISMVCKKIIIEKYILSGSLDWAEELDEWPCPFLIGSFDWADSWNEFW